MPLEFLRHSLLALDVTFDKSEAIVNPLPLKMTPPPSLFL